MGFPQSGTRPAADDLRGLMREHSLTQREVAEVACVSVKTVEGWLADPAAASHRAMPARHLHLVRAMLPAFLKKRTSQKKAP